MTTPAPSEVELDGVRYRIVPNSYKEWVESSYQAQPGIAGASRPSENPRPEIRTWRWDDWSKGEGYKFYNSTPGHPSQQGFYRTEVTDTVNGIDVLPPGQLRLGLTLATTRTAGAAALTGPHLAVAGDNVWAAYSQATDELSTLGTTIAADVWSSRVNGMGSNILGLVSGHMSGLFVAGVTGGVRRVTESGNTQWDATASRGTAASNNYVYSHVRGSTTSLLNRSALDAAVVGTTVVTFNGVGTTYAGFPHQSIAVGPKVYTLITSKFEAPRLWEYDGDAGREVAVFNALQIIAPAADTTEPMCVVDGIVFVGGYEFSAQNGGKETARLDYYAGDRWDTALRLTHYGENDILGTGSVLSAIYGLAPGSSHSVLMLTNIGLFRYSLETGGVWRLIGLESGAAPYEDGPCSVVEHRGVIFATPATSTTIVQRTLISGTGKYPSTCTVYGPIWDFDLPDTTKLLWEIVLETQQPADTIVDASIILDNTTLVTTDRNGANMSSGGQGASFIVSGSSVERTFRYLQPRLTLRTNATSATPVVYSMTMRAIPVPGAVRFFEFDINLADETSGDRKTGRQLTGAKQRATLETLRDSTSNRVFTMTPLYKDTKPPYPGPTETQHTVMFAANTVNGVFETDDVGEGRMRCKLMKLD